jgi:hypothetical protein
MLHLLGSLWQDESGFVGSSETVLLGTILIIGSIAGLVTVRDAVTTELGDLATGLLRMNQSYSYEPVVTDCGTVAGSIYLDRSDFCTPGLSDDFPPVQIGPIFINPGVNYDSGGTEQP